MLLSLPEPSAEEHKGEKYIPQQMTPDRELPATSPPRFQIKPVSLLECLACFIWFHSRGNAASQLKLLEFHMWNQGMETPGARVEDWGKRFEFNFCPCYKE